MSKNNDFVEYIIHDVLRELSGVTFKYMFGAHCLFANGKIFAIMEDDELFFKVDESNQKDYEKAGSKQFTYQSENGPMKMSYWQVPDDVMEDPVKAVAWASKSIAIKGKSKKKKK